MSPDPPPVAPPPDEPRRGVPPDELPLRVCPSCGAQERTRFERCRRCGANVFATPPSTVRRRRLALGAAGAVLLAAAAVGGILAVGDRDEREARDAVDRRARVAALRARLEQIQAPHQSAAPALRDRPSAPDAQRLAARAALVTAVEQQITRDARARAQAGELDGPIVETDCGPLLKSKEAVPDDRDLAKRIGRYDCVAAKRPIRNAEGVRVATLGHPFVTAVDFRRGTYTWCRNSPAQGEAGEALVFVRLERACLAAKGRAVGTGYVDVPGS